MGRNWVINEDLLGILIPIIAIIGWVVYAIVSAVTRARVRELEVRERIAMIEKGLVPPPEVDPRRFEERMSRATPTYEYDRYRYRTYRHRRGGFTLIAVGIGLMVLMFPSFRVGTFLLILGVFFLISSLFDSPRPPRPGYDPPPEPPRPTP
jgi:hypothetical protein